MSGIQGKIVWCELMTSDLDGAMAFYDAVIGWRLRDSGMPDRRYMLVSAGEVQMAGMMEMPPAARAGGMRPAWFGYIWADDVDAAAAQVAAQGGVVHSPPADIPCVGRFAMVADPQGAAFVLFRGADAGAGMPPAGATPGRIGWHELLAADQQAAFAFYAGLFGWTKSEAIDLGAMGVYQLFAIDGMTVGGMMTHQDPAQRPCWRYYINVEAADATVARIREAGGQVLLEPHQVPGGSWIVQGRDPQGATFAVVAPQR